MRDGDKSFGINNTSGDHARGSSNGGVSSGGFYGFDVGAGNRAIGMQATGGDWTPGSITLKLVNNSSSAISEMNIAYNIYVRNDQSRSSSFNLSISYDNSNFSDLSSGSYTSPEVSTGNQWIVTPMNIVLSGLSIAPGEDYYLRWSGSDVAGSGSRDEFALDDIVIGVAGATDPCEEPLAQAANLIFGTITGNSIQASFTSSDADKYLVVQSLQPTLDFDPVDGIIYNVGSAFGTGEVINYGVGTNINSLGLQENTEYHFYIFGANDNCLGGPDYMLMNPLMGMTSTITGTDYYDGISNATCSNLKTELHQLITNHTVASYASLWTHYQTTDDHMNDGGTELIVRDMYSDNPYGTEFEFTFVTEQCGTYMDEGQCYNREHSFPKSWWGAGTNNPQYSDLYAVIPVDGWINGIRNNNPYGEIQAGTESHIFNNGSALGSSSIYIPSYSGSVFEPIDAYKGDLARGYFYMMTRYEDVIASWETSTPESDAVLDGTTYPGYEPWMMNMLIEWHNIDPVDDEELARNEAIFMIQGNRNPYIDHPEYVDLVWGNCGWECSNVELTAGGEFNEVNGSNIPQWNITGEQGALMSGSVNSLTEAELEIINPGIESSDLQLWQDGLSMEADQLYVVRLSLEAEGDREVKVQLKNKTNGTYYLNREMAISTLSKEYVFLFNAPVTDNDLMLSLLVGNDILSVSVDHMRFKQYCDGDIINYNCVEILTLQDLDMDPIMYQAAKEIHSGGTISSNNDVLLKAADLISLEAGFEVEQGAIFETEIDGCP